MAPEQEKKRCVLEGVYPKCLRERVGMIAYERMLETIQQQIGWQPLSIASGAADEVLEILKNDFIMKESALKPSLEDQLYVELDEYSYNNLVKYGHLTMDCNEASDDGDSSRVQSEVELCSFGMVPDKEGHPESVQLNGQRQLLDLDSLAFCEGALVHADMRCQLPSDPQKDFEEVCVAALNQSHLGPGEELLNISELPLWLQPAFSGISQLNRVESHVYKSALFSNMNLLFCAPNGSGKTNVALLTILHQIGLNRNDHGSISHNNYKIVYVAPRKSLVDDVVVSLSNRLEHYGVKVKELSGDQFLMRHQIKECQIIVTSPENWEIFTRRPGLAKHVKLLIVDGIHLLDDNQGPVLESIIARTVRQIESTGECIRLVGLCTTIPNYENLANILRVDVKKGVFHFNNSYNHVPLAQQYIGINVMNPFKRFQLMNYICYEKLIDISGKHQVLIFVQSDEETVHTARSILKFSQDNATKRKFLEEDELSREILKAQTSLLECMCLRDLLPYGLAFHHAGMSRADRAILEELFAEGYVKVLVSTATFAWGVNLSAHTVIIKGTQIYNPAIGAWSELCPLDVKQMLGRAGRPQYDTCGEGIVITGQSELHYYRSLMNEEYHIESQFISKLADQLNAEIVLGTVQNVREACKWLLYTYLFVRMIQNPTLYGLPADITVRDPTLEERRSDLIHSAATRLDKNNLVKYDSDSGCFEVTDLGKIASVNYITHGTISTFNKQLKPTMGDSDLCWLFSLSEEFKHVTVKQDEKIELVKLLEKVPIPVKVSLVEPGAKTNLLLQAYISRVPLKGLSLRSDMDFISQSAGRLMRALFELVVGRGWAQLAEKALKWCKMIDKRMWSFHSHLRQFSIGDILDKLETEGVEREWCYDMDSQLVGEVLDELFIDRFPKLLLDAKVNTITRSRLNIELTITPDFEWDDKIHGHMEPFWVFVVVEDSAGGLILDHLYLMLEKVSVGGHLYVSLSVAGPLYHQNYSIKVISDRWVGAEYVHVLQAPDLPEN